MKSILLHLLSVLLMGISFGAFGLMFTWWNEGCSFWQVASACITCAVFLTLRDLVEDKLK